MSIGTTHGQFQNTFAQFILMRQQFELLKPRGARYHGAKCKFPDQFVHEKFKFWSGKNALIDNAGNGFPHPRQMMDNSL